MQRPAVVKQTPTAFISGETRLLSFVAGVPARGDRSCCAMHAPRRYTCTLQNEIDQIRALTNRDQA